MLIVLKSGSLNLLEPSGPVQDFNGIALPSTNYIWRYRRFDNDTDVTSIPTKEYVSGQ